MLGLLYAAKPKAANILTTEPERACETSIRLRLFESSLTHKECLAAILIVVVALFSDVDHQTSCISYEYKTIILNMVPPCKLPLSYTVRLDVKKFLHENRRYSRRRAAAALLPDDAPRPRSRLLVMRQIMKLPPISLIRVIMIALTGALRNGRRMPV
ncbi:hypothetical protein EVAR_75065_1 [Eumeta japonica]|uniref:Uncharacterized protein n=1 Tax=Eumeta variegata TaxID=151549 RepID=A0A4C1VZZ6_EUMVA|nr:hypothetical protein EVAR_75065_1 [Eumeta japonica]